MESQVKNLGLVAAIVEGTEPPDNIKLIWWDTNDNVQKVYRNGEWIDILGGGGAANIFNLQSDGRQIHREDMPGSIRRIRSGSNDILVDYSTDQNAIIIAMAEYIRWSAPAITMGHEQDTILIGLTSNINNWSISAVDASNNPISMPSWINISPIFGSNDETIIVTTTSDNIGNYNNQIRLIASGVSEGRTITSKILLVTQLSTVPQDSITLLQNIWDVPYQENGIRIGVDVQGLNKSFTVAPTPSWITVVPGSNYIDVYITQNTGALRTGSVTVNHSNGTLTDTLNISQSAYPTLSVSPTSPVGILIQRTGGSVNFTVTTTGGDWAYSVTGDITYFTINRTGNNLSVTANGANILSRELDIYITFRHAVHTSITRTENIKQKMYTINVVPNTTHVISDQNESIFTVTTDVPGGAYTVTYNNLWLHGVTSSTNPTLNVFSETQVTYPLPVPSRTGTFTVSASPAVPYTATIIQDGRT